MDRKASFNEIPKEYDKWRPRYCEELFGKIISHSNLDHTKNAVEIGIGAGQATEGFLKTGCRIAAVEYGDKLAEYSQQKFSGYPNLAIVNATFEEYACEKESVDLVYSGTAFHWIPADISYAKVYDMLKSGGTIALFWNKPFTNRMNDPLHQKIQTIYQKYSRADKPQIENDKERYRYISGMIRAQGFMDCTLTLFHQKREFASNDYISLIKTYSDHHVMPEPQKSAFEQEIKTAIEAFGGVIQVYDTIDLHLARKP